MKKSIILIITLIMAVTVADSAPIVDIKTTMGDIKVKLYDDTPIHRDNFLKLVNEGFYNGVLFHRVIKDFMIQTGDPESVNADSTAMLGSGDPGYKLDAEILYPTHFHKYGALAAARTGDQVNPERKSSGSQFYIVTGEVQNPRVLEVLESRANNERKRAYFTKLIKQHSEEINALRQAGDTVRLEELRQRLADETEANVKDIPLPDEIKEAYTTVGGTPHLDGQYTVFGEVIEGMDVVEKIQNVATGKADRPKEDIRILSAKVEK